MGVLTISKYLVKFILHSKIFNIPYKNIHIHKGESLKVRSTEEYLGQSCDLGNPPTLSLCPKSLAFRGRRQGRQPLNPATPSGGGG